MTLIQKFNPELCKKIGCEYLLFGRACFFDPEKCKKNREWGYPKVVEKQNKKNKEGVEKRDVVLRLKKMDVVFHHGRCDICGERFVLICHFNYSKQPDNDVRLCSNCLGIIKNIMEDVIEEAGKDG